MHTPTHVSLISRYKDVTVSSSQLEKSSGNPLATQVSSRRVGGSGQLAATLVQAKACVSMVGEGGGGGMRKTKKINVGTITFTSLPMNAAGRVSYNISLATAFHLITYGIKFILG